MHVVLQRYNPASPPNFVPNAATQHGLGLHALETELNESLATFNAEAAGLLSASRLDETHREIQETSDVLRSRLLDTNEKAWLKLGAARAEVSLLFAKFVSNRKAELEANKNSKSRADFHAEIEERTRRILDEDLRVALAAAGLEGGYADLRASLEEEMLGEARRLSIANRNANRRLNGEVMAEDMARPKAKA